MPDRLARPKVTSPQRESGIASTPSHGDLSDLPKLSPSRRLRRTPFSRGVEAAGVKAYTIYNHMLLPTVFESIKADCAHLKSHVQVWDVSCERQIEVTGPDAGRLVQMITPRDVSKISNGQCMYIPVVNARGGMLNDPVLIRLAEDRYWISIASSDLLLWVDGIATALGLNVSVFEPDIHPLAVQGPKADELMARLFGPQVLDIRFFRARELTFESSSYVVARSGYSKQGGFEIYVNGGGGMALWQSLMGAGQDLHVRAGGPNLIERIEGGLLGFGNDMTADNNPYECGLEKFCQPQTVDCIGRDALLAIEKQGPQRKIRPIAIAGDKVPICDRLWPVTVGGALVGQVSSAIYAPAQQVNVAIGMIDKAHWQGGTSVVVHCQDGDRPATVNEEFWI